jgi:2-amino-4-hydroxy-6-hydroxymethyldihydropteridine diphosphokinase
VTNKKIVFVLGSNIGNREFYLENAIKNLTIELELTNIKTSQTLENKAMLLPNSPKEWNIDFLNQALSGNINLDNLPPLKILEITKKIEINLGRQNRGKWAPREIDIDIALIEDLKIDLPELKIPHPGVFDREFFKKTILEII